MANVEIPGAPDNVGRVRARAEARCREVPALGRRMDDRPMVHKLAIRADDDTVDRWSPGAGLSAAGLGVRERKVTVSPSPNSPLLMRIVRTPYALETVRGRRSQAWDRPRTDRIERLPRPGEAWRSSRTGRLFLSPLRIEHGLPDRMRPRKSTADAGAKGVGG